MNPVSTITYEVQGLDTEVGYNEYEDCRSWAEAINMAAKMSRRGLANISVQKLDKVDTVTVLGIWQYIDHELQKVWPK